MKTHERIGISAEQYGRIIQDAYISWIMNNAATGKQAQLAFQEKALLNYFKFELREINHRFATHLNLFKKPQTVSQILDLYFQHLNKFKLYFPKALLPKVAQKQAELTN